MSTNFNDKNTKRTGSSAPRSSINRRKRKRRYDPLRLGVIFLAAALIIAGCGLGGFYAIRGIGALFSGPKEKTADSLSSTSSSQSSDSSASSTSSGQSSESTETAPAAGEAVEHLRTLRTALEKATAPNELADLEEQINNYLTEHNIDQSKISWAVQDLTTEAYIESDNARDNFTAASTYKLPLCMHYYEEIAAGNINPNDTLLYSEEMREDEDKENLNQPIHRKYKVGDRIQIDELLEAALLYSDNIAGHMLYENLGGYTKFKEIVSRYSPLEQTPEFYSEKYNVLNADYMMRLLAIIYNTPGTFNDLKYWLQNASIDTYLNRTLNGHYIQKIGNINEVRNAGGISNGPAPFSVSIYSCIGKQEGQDVIDDLGVLINNYFENKYASGFYNGEKAELIQMLNNQLSQPYDVIYYRPGENGQTLPDMTPEEESMANEALHSD